MVNLTTFKGYGNRFLLLWLTNSYYRYIYKNCYYIKYLGDLDIFLAKKI